MQPALRFCRMPWQRACTLIVVALTLATQVCAQEPAPAASAADAGALAAPPPAIESGPQPSANAPSGMAAPASSTPAQQAPPPTTPVSDANYRAVAVTPAPGPRIALDKVPRNVQRIDASMLAAQHPLGLHEALEARLGSVAINDVQSNPLQPDFQYRGFTASPLLGTPQGLAVYQNGVRINEPFGDLLQWDLVPVFALHEVQMLPGANPVYGLNALGGSLVLRMKNGFSDPGYRVEALSGSFARYQTSAEYGRAFGDWAVYTGASAFGEQGFRDVSSSTARNLYADLRHRTEQQEIGVSATLAHTSLNGNGPAPVELLEQDRAAVYTFADNTKNELLMITSDASQRLTDRVALQATAYLRHAQRNTSNGDEANFQSCPAGPAGPAMQPLVCDEDGKQVRSETNMTVATSDPFDALYNTTQTASDGYGGSLQMSMDERLAARPNQLVAGASYDGSHVGFGQRAELGRLTPARGVEGAGVFLAGDEHRTALEVENRQLGIYASDTFTLADPLAVNVSARFNWVDTELQDRLGEALTGNHAFARVNPALGLTYNPISALTVFSGYGESNRAPSAAELACADPNQPCRVPNAFIADPPLAQVVSRSLELGLRAHAGPRRLPWLEGSLAGFGARNSNDIMFVAGSHVGTGYFRNAGTTQRLGLELSLAGHVGRLLEWYASYTFLKATFESRLELPGQANPAAHDSGADGERVIDVKKGDHIPGLPAHSVKAGLTVSPLDRLELGVSVIAHSSQFLRGDEANLLHPLDGYMLLNAQVSYRLFDPLTVFIKAQNLLNKRYETFGVLANPTEVLPRESNPRFLSPGAPLGIWAGIIVSER